MHAVYLWIKLPRPLLVLEESQPVAKFKVGDRVERVGTLVPVYMHDGIILRIIPNKEGIDGYTEYEVNFGNQMIGTFYEAQLRLVKPATED